MRVLDCSIEPKEGTDKEDNKVSYQMWTCKVVCTSGENAGKDHMMFLNVYPPNDAGAYSWGSNKSLKDIGAIIKASGQEYIVNTSTGKPVCGEFFERRLPFVLLHHQSAVGATEAEGVGKRHIELGLASGARHEVQVALLVRILEVESAGENLLPDRQSQEATLEAACRTQQMTGRGLRG